MNAGAGNWGRQGYFNAATGESSGLVFLNNKGGDACSGTFDYSFGNSLSYASSDGKTCSSSHSQVLKDGWVDDSIEVALFTDAPCERGACGYSRPKSVAYHGFRRRESKMFLLEFDMPVNRSPGVEHGHASCMDPKRRHPKDSAVCQSTPECSLLDFWLRRVGHLRSP